MIKKLSLLCVTAALSYQANAAEISCYYQLYCQKHQDTGEVVCIGDHNEHLPPVWYVGAHSPFNDYHTIVFDHIGGKWQRTPHIASCTYRGHTTPDTLEITENNDQTPYSPMPHDYERWVYNKDRSAATCVRSDGHPCTFTDDLTELETYKQP